MVNTSINKDGLIIEAQDLSLLTPGSENDGRLYNHDGSSSITLTTGDTTTDTGFYMWDASASSWNPLKNTFHAAENIETNGSAAKVTDTTNNLDIARFLEGGGVEILNGSLNIGSNSITGDAGVMDLKGGNIYFGASSSGTGYLFKDSGGTTLLQMYEGGNAELPNGKLTLSDSLDFMDSDGDGSSWSFYEDGSNGNFGLDVGGSYSIFSRPNQSVVVPNGNFEVTSGNFVQDISNGQISLDADNTARTGIGWTEGGVQKWSVTYTNEGLKWTDAVNNIDALRLDLGGNADFPSGQLSEQGNRVATRTWTNTHISDTTNPHSVTASQTGATQSVVKVSHSVSQDINLGTEAVVDFDTTLFNYGSDIVHDSANSAIDIQTDGLYRFNVHLAGQRGDTNNARTSPHGRLRKNGGTSGTEVALFNNAYIRNAESHDWSTLQCTVTLELVAGDTIHVTSSNDTSNTYSMDVPGNTSRCWWEVEKLVV